MTHAPAPAAGESSPGLAERVAGRSAADVFDVFVEWAAGRGFTLYPAQEDALIALASDANVILSTPTGTGKSLVAVGAHACALAQRRRSYYTAPIKALVSEKFFALVETFGAQNVGMLTGDSSVNPRAPIICCTAEILANLALRQGEHADVGQVVMDEFHFYADPDRGWAWQVPLLTLPRTQFLLMSATLGDTSQISEDLSRRTGRPTETVTGVTRPVPLTYRWATTPVHETIDDLLAGGEAPVYVVHFSQSAAVERAQALASAKVASREHRDRIADAIGAFRFSAGFGATLSRLLRMGIGVHHAGMLPKYRRLVEQLAQRGLLRVICGTDTLGVGINVPIRSVLLTALTKFDGTRMRRLTAREFHQIAGRAGRAGYDTVGTVVAQAPEYEIENLRAELKAAGDAKKKRKIVRKKPPPGFVTWREKSFQGLIAAQPETLTPQLKVTSAMLVNVISRGGDAYRAVHELIFDNHEPWKSQLALARRALGIYRTLTLAGVVEKTADGIRLTVDLPEDFALNQPLSPFALAALELLDTTSPDYALDAISVFESTLDDPRPVLAGQEFAARGEAVAAMKAEGIDYDERMALLEDVSYPKPLEELLTSAFETFAAAQPWVRDLELRPKAVVRDMYERAQSFAEYIALYRLARSEGVVLRYLSDAYRAVRQTTPPAAYTEELTEIVEWLGELVRQVDSSLLDEWEQLVHPDIAARTAADREVVPPAPADVTGNRRAFLVLVRNELFRRVQAAALGNAAALGELDPDFGEQGWRDALSRYRDRHESIGTGPAARGASLLLVDDGAPGIWRVRQILDDPDGDHDWGITAVVDLADSAARGDAVIRVVSVDDDPARWRDAG